MGDLLHSEEKIRFLRPDSHGAQSVASREHVQKGANLQNARGRNEHVKPFKGACGSFAESESEGFPATAICSLSTKTEALHLERGMSFAERRLRAVD